MKLLIITQVVDKNHPILGFFHRWLEEFATQTSELHVIALQVGEHSLPKNVTVHSLGKEEGRGKLTYLYRFFSLIWKLRKKYDSVFVHMNQIYVLLGGIFWRLWGKRVGLWYAHGAVSTSLRLAVQLTHYVFTSTKEGFRIPTKKVKIVGQGVDIDNFIAKPKRENNQVLRLVTVGRIAQAKNIETLLHACQLLQKESVAYVFDIIGVATTDAEERYASEMKKLAEELGVSDSVVWQGSVKNEVLPAYLQVADLFIHDGTTNSLDKTLVEAALCGCVVLSSNPAYRQETEHLAARFLFPVNDSHALANRIIENRQGSRTAVSIGQYFRKKYSVHQLISNILSYY